MLRGRLTSKLLPDAAGGGPALLRRTSQIRIPMAMAGLAWVSVDSLCGVYYEVSLEIKDISLRRGLS